MNLVARLQLRADLCQLLQKNYVALLGQRGNGSKTLTRLIVNNESPLPGMKFITAVLPQGTMDSDEFMELLLLNLVDVASQVSPREFISRKIEEAISSSENIPIFIRIRTVLSILGKHSDASYLVIVLHALANVEEKPLKELLLLLREYHGQMDIPGQSGERLRFLIVGGMRLWNLCCQKNDQFQSPFNIAQRFLLEGFSYQDLVSHFEEITTEEVVRLRNLTDGVPPLLELVRQSYSDIEDLSSYFGPLENRWNSLSTNAQISLKKLIPSSDFPKCQVDYECPIIPKLDETPIWKEIFWSGFVKVRYRELVWRSPLHKSFVMHHVYSDVDTDVSKLLNDDARSRLERLINLLERKQKRRVLDECAEELVYLSVYSKNTKIVSLLRSIYEHHPNDEIISQLKEFSTHSDRKWLTQLASLDLQPSKSFIYRLIVFISQGVSQDLNNSNQEETEYVKTDAVDEHITTFPEYRVEDQPWYAGLFPDTMQATNKEIKEYSNVIDAVIMTATDIELRTVLSYLRPFPRKKKIRLSYSGPETYYMGMFGVYRAVVTKCRMGSIGEGSVVLATEQAQRLWRPKAVIMVGIAFGIDPYKQRIADVLVASQIISYEQQRIGDAIVYRGSRPPSNTTLLNRFENQQNWKFTRPDQSYSNVIVGPILSGEKLVDDPKYKEALSNEFPQAIGGEMEGAGLGAASNRIGTAWILVKAICDWAQGAKDDRHQDLAAAAATSLVYSVLSQPNALSGLNKLTPPA